jgi:hypothetical protein
LVESEEGEVGIAEMQQAMVELARIGLGAPGVALRGLRGHLCTTRRFKHDFDVRLADAG